MNKVNVLPWVTDFSEHKLCILSVPYPPSTQQRRPRRGRAPHVLSAEQPPEPIHPSTGAMRLPPPATSTLASLLTPSLLVSLPVLERNEAACRALMRGTGVQLRPHAKAHKSSGLARWLLARGGDELSGLCAQTVDEAEVMVGAAQCKDVLLTNEVIGPQKLERLAGLAASHPDAAIGVLVDSLFGVDALSAAMRARAPSATISAYVEIECGQDRCAVPPA